MTEAKPTGVTLGTVIAFVAPGFITLRGAAYHLPIAANWIDAAVAKEQNVGIFFFALLASLSLGIVVSGIRSMLLDPLYHRGVFKLKPVSRVRLPFSELTTEHRLAAFEGIVENYYKYYQFYANTFVALLLLVIAHATADGAAKWSGVLYAVLFLSLLALFFAARSSLSQYSSAAEQLFVNRSGSNAQRLATSQTTQKG